MKTVMTVITCVILFVITGFVAYLVESILFRYLGIIGRYESLWAYFRKIDQKHGNIAAAAWAGIWVLTMIICGFSIYVMS